ncbi:MAG: hypothetical protein VKI81_01845 [Synechococcaceae cyanobacterium]|nr:hypothetical protein [Synechococcaceae cyanobacterium]
MPEPSSGNEQTATALREELTATRERIEAYSRLVEELPSLYERKFGERLEPLLERTRGLLEERQQLQEQLAALPPSAAGDPPGAPAALPPAGPRRFPLQTPLPGGSRRTWLLALAGGACLALLGIGLGTRRLAGPQPPVPRPAAAARPTEPDPANPAAAQASAGSKAAPQVSAAPGELLLSAEGLSWLEVRTLEGERLFVGNLQGSRRFPLGRGLRISAGRPDLVRVHRHGEPPRRMGRIEEIDWKTFAPAEQTAEESARPPG